MTQKEPHSHSALCHPTVPSSHFTVSYVVLPPSRSSQPGICPSPASAVRLVICAALTSRELSRGALDCSTSSLKFENLPNSVEWPDFAAQTPQDLSPVRRIFVSNRFALLDCRRKRSAIFHQTLRSVLTFVTPSSTLEESLLVTQSVVAAPVDRMADSGRVPTQRSRHQTFCSLQQL